MTVAMVTPWVEGQGDPCPSSTEDDDAGDEGDQELELSFCLTKEWRSKNRERERERRKSVEERWTDSLRPKKGEEEEEEKEEDEGMKERAVSRSVSLSLCPGLWERDAFRRSTCPPTLARQPITGRDRHTHSHTHACMYTHMCRVTMVTASPLPVLESNCKQHQIIQEIKLHSYKYFCTSKSQTADISAQNSSDVTA